MSTQDNANSSVRVLLGIAHLTQRQLARNIGMDHASLSTRLNGRTMWTTVDLDKVADHFGINAWDLLMGPVRALEAYEQAHGSIPWKQNTAGQTTCTVPA